jgi:general secretion pathway protein L
MSSALELAGSGLRWWFGALASIFIRRPEPFSRGAVRLRPRNGGFAVIEADGTSRHHLAIGTPNSRALRRVRRARSRYLDFPDESVLTVKAVLPAAARPDPREAIALRMDELTPFTEEEVLFDVTAPTPVGTDRFAVHVFVVPRAAVSQRLAELASLGIAADAVIASETGEATGADVPNFAPDILRRRGIRSGVACGIACLLLVAAGGWLHWAVTDRQRRELELLQDAVATAIADVRRANEIDQQIAALSATLTSPQARRAGTVGALELLDGLARALPDDAYLTGLGWSGDEIVISGLAADASALIGQLEASPVLSEVRYSAPIARDPRLGRDRFVLTARTTAGGRPQ